MTGLVAANPRDRYRTRMPIEKWSDSVVVVHLADDPQLTEDLVTLEQSAEQHKTDAVLDFAAVRFINSSNIAKLLKLRKRMNADGSHLVLCNVGNQVWGALLVTGLDKIFQFSDNVPTALATLQMH
jgi:anti-anti-sigma factor